MPALFSRQFHPTIEAWRMWRLNLIVLLLAAAALIGGCAVRPPAEALLPTSAIAADMRAVSILAVTNRTPAAGGFSAGRGQLRYDEFTVMVTPARPGAIRDMSRDFKVAARRELDAAAFNALVAERQAKASSTMVFVHGYNFSYQESLFRFAQMGADSSAPVVPVLFSWPSEASVTGYDADRDAATFARADLAKVIVDVASSGRKPVTVVGHSMGAWLVMEAVGQLRLSGKSAVVARLELGLAAPDIDVDVFRSQVATIGRGRVPIAVLVSKDDAALLLSSRLAMGRPRLGALDVDDPATTLLARQTGASIVDISSLPATDGFNHDRFLALATFGTQIRRGGDFLQTISHSGAYILDATGGLLRPQF